MPVTIRDVARSLNLSHTTVSRVLNDRDSISIPAVTRERVRTAARHMGYTPNRSARALATGRTNLVALQIHRLTSPYAWMVSQEMQSIANRDGYELLVREYGGGDLTLQSSVDGIVALDAGHAPHGASPVDDTRLSVPYVQMGTHGVNPAHMDSVDVDFQHGARQAVQHLVEMGRCRIAHVTSKSDMPGDARCCGYRAVMAEAGLPAKFIDVPDDYRASGYAAIAHGAAQGSLPDALFCRNDELATGCLRALHELGRRVPEDVAVIGCDAIEEGEYLQPPLSTIVLPVAEMCRTAWHFLQRRMAEPDAPQQTAMLKSSLLVRSSA